MQLKGKTARQGRLLYSWAPQERSCSTIAMMHSRPWARRPLQLALLTLLLALLLHSSAATESDWDSCLKQPPSQYSQYCSASATLRRGQNSTYVFYVADFEAEAGSYDIQVDLSSSTGDTDL